MKLTISHPSGAIVEGNEDELNSLRATLTYTNTAIQHDIKRHLNNFWFRSKNPETWQSTLDSLKKSAKRTLVSEENGKFTIYPGSIPYLSSLNVQIDNQIKYPVPRKIPWKNPLPFELHPYQEESWQKLLAIKHGNVELCTGAGKTSIILKLCRETGFRTAIVAPSKSIFTELLEKFEYHFGKGSVGTFGAGRKKLDKRFTICIGDSLSNVKPNTPEWEFFSNLDMLIVDESHVWGAETLENVCFGVLGGIPYRFFLSGTQVRGDGGLMLLQAIIGQTVGKLTTKQAVDGGYICPHKYNVVNVESSNPNYNDQDVLQMKRAHVLRNRNICAFIAKLANGVVTHKNEQVLVLVEELRQISDLVKLLKVPYSIAHSETKPERLATLGLEKVDVSESIELFNKGISKVLVGTSTIRTGCNIYPVNHCINWVAGASEVATRQGCVGRSVRFSHQNPWATQCPPKPFATIWDFNVFDVDIMVRHLKKRLEYYGESGSEIKYINLPK
jgi:Type III restriction enzyme, res subunit/Helicase conserved C-terminal domain